MLTTCGGEDAMTDPPVDDVPGHEDIPGTVPETDAREKPGTDSAALRECKTTAPLKGQRIEFLA